MRHMIVTIPFIKEVKTMRKAMVENLIDLMKLHGVNEVDCSKVNDCPPVIHVGICDEDVTTLNTIELVIDDVYEELKRMREYCKLFIDAFDALEKLTETK